MGFPVIGIVSWSAPSNAPSLVGALEADVLRGLGLTQVHDDDRARVEQTFVTARENKHPVFLVHRVLNAERRVLWVATVASLDDRGVFQGTLIELAETLGDGRRIDQVERFATVISSVHQSLGRDSDSSGLLQLTCELLVERGGFDAACVFDLGSEDAVGETFASVGCEREPFSLVKSSVTVARLRELLGDAGKVVLKTNLVTAAELGRPDVPFDPPLSVAIIPLRRTNEAFAALMLSSQDGRKLQGSDVRQLAQLGVDVGHALVQLADGDRYHRLFEESRDPMFVIDRGMRIIDSNSAVAALLGSDRATLKSMRYSDLLDARQPAPVQPNVGESSNMAQRQLRHADGHWVQVDETIHSLKDGTMHVVVQDLTARRQLEGKLQLTDRLVSLGTLAAGVAHELNNPLSWIISNLTQAKGQLDAVREDVRAEMNELLTESLDGAYRIVSVISELRTFSRPNTAPGKVSLHNVVNRSVHLLSLQAKYRGKLTKQLGPVPDVIGSELQLSQVIVNLMLNAVQSLSESKADNEVVVETMTDAEGAAVIEVRDTGHGIPPEVLGRIFDPFFTTKAVGVGTGLGLSVAYNIINSLGGRIEVRSTLAKGSTFRIVLPAAIASLTPVPTNG